MDARKKQKHSRTYSIGIIHKMSTSTYSPPSMKRQVNYDENWNRGYDNSIELGEKEDSPLYWRSEINSFPLL